MVYMNGALYFVASRAWFRKKPRIMRFDLSDEVFRGVMLPSCIASDYCSGFPYPSSNRQRFHLCAYRESLAILRCDDSTDVLKIWAMGEHGVEASWTHLSTFSLEFLGNSRNKEITGLMFVNDSRVVLSIASTWYGAASIFFHDLKSQEIEKMEIVGEHNCVFLGDYVESLVLLDKGNDLRRYIVDFVMNQEWKPFQTTAKREAQALRKVRDSASEIVRNKDYTRVPMSKLVSKFVPYGSSIRQCWIPEEEI